MTVIGPDRPGLVDALATVIAEHGGNWLDSRMCRLAGQFAGILRADVPSDHQPRILEALKRLENQGMSVHVAADATPPRPAPVTLEIGFIGHDQPGIVRQIFHALARHGANVEDLTTQQTSAPMTGDRLFHARAVVSLPPDANPQALRDELEAIAADLMVDLSFGKEPEAAEA